MCFFILAEFNIYTQSEVRLIIVMDVSLTAAQDIIMFLFYIFQTFKTFSLRYYLYKNIL